jgi:hypothetical protein
VADKKISELTAATALSGTELVPIVQGGETVRTTIGNIKKTVIDSSVNYYVRSDGSDANDGTANTAAGAWLTINHALAWCAENLYINVLGTVTINVQDGTWTGQVIVDPVEGDGFFIVTGNAADNTAVVLSGTSLGYLVYVGRGSSVLFSNLTLEGNGNCTFLVNFDAAQSGGFINCRFGSAVTGQILIGGGQITLSGDNEVFGTAGYFANVGSNDGMLFCHHDSFTITGDPGWVTGFLVASTNGYAYFAPDTVTGAANSTGKKFLSDRGGRIEFANAITTVADIPGTTAGTAAADGVVSVEGTVVAPSFTGDSGTGGKIGYVPAPAAGDAAAAKFLKADATWAAPTAAPAGATTQVQYNNAGAMAGDDEFTYDSTGAITLGKATGGTGKVLLKGTTSGTVTLSTADAAGTWTMKLPTSGGTNTHVLTTDGTGVTSWTAPGTTANLVIGTSTITSGTTTRVLYDLAGVVQEATGFTISSNQPNVTAGNSYLHDGTLIASGTAANFNWRFANGGNANGVVNIAIGDAALAASDTGQSNLAIGYHALQTSDGGSYNVGLGREALQALTTTSDNTAVGYRAMFKATTASDSVAIGYLAMSNGVNTGTGNVAVGVQALDENTSGQNNFGLGTAALQLCTTSSDNVAIGPSALDAITTGSGGNVGIGSSSLTSATGRDNVAIGRSSANLLTSGDYNIVIGSSSTPGVTTGSYNTIVGSQITGLSTTLANAIILADGQGNIKFDYNKTTASTTTINSDTDVVGNVKATSVRGTAVTYANRPGTPVTGMIVAISDSSTATWGATITGGGANSVLAWYNGTNWTVIGA